MASTVLSGTGNVTYTNSTGQNVRVIINFMRSYSVSRGGGVIDHYISMSWAGVSIVNGSGGASGSSQFSIGRNLAYTNYGGYAGMTSNNANGGSYTTNLDYPTEIMLTPGQTFSASCTAHNIVIIPEAG
jgi:hypothetical protein